MGDSIFNNDPIYIKNLLGKTVSIETVDNKHHTGLVYVIDPIYKTVVLLDKEARSSLELILHHAIKDFQVISDDNQLNLVQDVKVEEPHHEKRAQLFKWLKHMFIDVKDDGEYLRVDDHLIIGPPYTKDDCMCDNTIVLERIRNIIDLKPANFE